MSAAPATVVPVDVDVSQVQRRTLRLLFVTQIAAGIGTTIGGTVGALLAARLGGVGVSGFAASSFTVGAALLAIPVTRVMRGYGRRPGLALAYLAGALGAVVTVVAATVESVPLLFAGMLLFGGGTAASLQARYTAVDLAEPTRRGRQLSLIVWATTLGAVTAPNLAADADGVARRFGLPEYAGPFAFSAVVFVLAAVALTLLLRPDPLLLARARAAAVAAEPATSAPGGMRAAFAVVRGVPAARLGIAAVAMGHLVMVGVMSMTPVHIEDGSGDHSTVLRTVGLVLSMHIAGMFALSPVVGWLTDRFGRRPVIVGGLGVLLLACAVAGSAGHDTVRLTVGLALLGLGWSGTMVAGSTLLSESVAADVRPAVQGLSDMVMGFAGAFAGAVAGVIVDVAGYRTLNLVLAVATVPLVALALRSAGERSGAECA